GYQGFESLLLRQFFAVLLVPGFREHRDRVRVAGSATPSSGERETERRGVRRPRFVTSPRSRGVNPFIVRSRRMLSDTQLKRLLDLWFEQGDDVALEGAFRSLWHFLRLPLGFRRALGDSEADDVRQEVLMRLLDARH